MTDKKKQKRSEEIAIALREGEKAFRQYIEESIKAIRLETQKYEYEVNGLSSKLRESKTEKAIHAGKILATGILRDNPGLICRTLQKEYRGYIDRTVIWEACKRYNPDWVAERTGFNRRKRTKLGSQFLNIPALTEQEKQYIEAFERETIRDKTMAKLVYEFTNIDTAGQGRIIMDTPKGSDWRQRFADKAQNYMIQISKQMTDSQVGTTLSDIRTVREIASAFSDILYEELEIRKKKGELFKE
jgi:hypothetical protein